MSCPTRVRRLICLWLSVPVYVLYSRQASADGSCAIVKPSYFAKARVIKKMSLIEKISGCVLGTMVAAASFGQVAHAQVSLTINDEAPLSVLPSANVPAGMSFATTTLGTLLSVNTDGFLFCANVYYLDSPNPQKAVTLVPGHTTWTLPTAFDLQSIAYTDGALNVNLPLGGPALETSLTCRTRGPNGEFASPFSSFGDGIFRDDYERGRQLANMFNWSTSGTNYDWYAANWSQLPTDACSFDGSASDRPSLDEPTLCAAASGVRAIAGSAPGSFGQHIPTMWTYNTATSFVYLARVDLRVGADTHAPNTHFDPILVQSQQLQTLPNAVTVAVRDGFDARFLAAGGTYCQLNALPTTLTEAVCGNSGKALPSDGRLSINTGLSLSNPYSPAASYYVAVVRAIIGAPPASVATTPVVAMAVLTDPVIVHEDGGNSFTGDDVVFGFMPGAQGFPWMRP